MSWDKSTIEGREFAEFQEFVLNRENESEMSLWIGSEYPCMNLLIKGEIAHMCYFPSRDHPGYISQNGQNNEGSILINGSDHIEVPTDSIISVNTALEAAKEFCETSALPKNSKWLEL